MKFDELYKKVIGSCMAFEKRRVPINLEFKIDVLKEIETDILGDE